MKHGMFVLLALAAAAFAMLVSNMLRDGHEMRRREVAALSAVRELLDAERRCYDANRKTPYLPLAELIEAAELEGFEPLPEGTGPADLVCRDGYLFRVRLLPPLSSDSEDHRMGARFQLWAWPEDPSDLASVLYWCDNAGFLLQGENGMAAGAHRPPPLDVQPLRELTRDTEEIAAEQRKTTRWFLIESAAGSPDQ